jgi:hypothetical protein
MAIIERDHYPDNALNKLDTALNDIEKLKRTASTAGITTSDVSALIAAHAADSEAHHATIPDASTTVKGIVELATAAETQAGTSATLAVTPSGIGVKGDSNPTNHDRYTDAEALAAVPDASTTVKGKVELATAAETLAGTSGTLVVTPSGIGAKADANTLNHDRYTDAEALAAVPNASTTVKGIVELATDAETQTGTATTIVITPANLTAATASEATASRIAKRDSNGYCKFHKVYLETLNAYTTPANVEYIHTKQSGATAISQVTPAVLDAACAAAVAGYRYHQAAARDTTNWGSTAKTAGTYTITTTDATWGLPSGLKAVVVRCSSRWATDNYYMGVKQYGASEYALVCRGNIANKTFDGNAIVPVDSSGRIEVYISGNSTATTLDIWGYFL